MRFAIIGVGVSLAGLILYSQHNLRADLRAEMLDLREETRAEFKVVHEEFKAVRSEMKSEFNIHLEVINRLRDREFRNHTEVVNDALRKVREMESGIEAIRRRLIAAENTGFTDMTMDEIWEEARRDGQVSP